MRAILVCLALAACATAPPLPPAERLAGCWINRDAGASTMRWIADGEHPGVMNGELHRTGRAPTRYVLTPTNEGDLFCRLDEDGAATSRCWAVASGQGGSLDGGRVFIDAFGDRLRIEVLGDGPSRVLFQGRRDGCD